MRRRDLRDRAQALEQRVRAEPAEVTHEAVIGKDVQLVGGEQHAQEPVVLLVAAVAGIVATAFGRRARGRRAAVMAVGDVRAVDARERVDVRPRIVDAPHGVAHAVLGREVVERRRPAWPPTTSADRVALRLVGEEDRAGIGVDRQRVARAVVFLVLARDLVLLDALGVVVVDVATADDADLAHAPAGEGGLLPIGVQTGLGLAHQHAAVDHVLEATARGRVHAVVVWVDLVGQVDLRARNVQQAVLVALTQRARLFAVDDVVGNGGDLRGQLGPGPERGERT